MNIGPLSGSRDLLPSVPRPDGSASGDGAAAAGQTPAARRIERPLRADPASDAHPQTPSGPDAEELKKLATQARLELRLQSLPNSSVVVIRIVNPETGEVVREYPPERLAKAMEELRTRAASHIDRKA